MIFFAFSNIISLNSNAVRRGEREREIILYVFTLQFHSYNCGNNTRCLVAHSHPPHARQLVNLTVKKLFR